MNAQIKRAWAKAPVSMFFATCGGIGHIPGGPGTYAAIVALPSIWWLSHTISPWMHVLVALGASVLGVYWCEMAGRALEEEDSRKIVFDEWAGVWLTLAPFAALSIVELLVGLVAFRIFDMKKPWPVSWADKNVKGGLGVMLDDVLAAVMAALVVFVLRGIL